jgi:hypothetical protein
MLPLHGVILLHQGSCRLSHFRDDFFGTIAFAIVVRRSVVFGK